MEEKRKLIESALFIAAKPLTIEELKNIIKLDDSEIKNLLEKMKEKYDDHGIRVVENDGMYELRVKDEYVKDVEHLAPNTDFSRGTLQTLSLIAYKAPVKQSIIVKVRGNRAYDQIKELKERGFVRKEPHGHTRILHLTQNFLEYFNLKSQEQVKGFFKSKAKDPESFKVEIPKEE